MESYEEMLMQQYVNNSYQSENIEHDDHYNTHSDSNWWDGH